jgi:hypothetical protein
MGASAVNTNFKIMQRAIFFFFIWILLLSSCSENSPARQDSTEYEKIEDDTLTTYFPEKYEEEILDTILDPENNFKVLIKKSTLMDKSIVQTIELDNKQIQKLVYRDKSILIKVTIGERILLDTLLTKGIFPQIGDNDFLRKAIMWGAWIEKYDKINKEVTLSCNVIVPDSDWGYNFIIKVDNKAKKKYCLTT